MDTINQNNTKYRDALFDKYKGIFATDTNLNRQLVSFQANKSNPVFRWFKYKEGFSSNLVQYYILKFGLEGSKVLDPYAGVGTTLFVSSEMGCDATGIELLPVGIFVMEFRQIVTNIQVENIKAEKDKIWKALESIPDNIKHIEHISITEGAFPVETERLLNKYLEYCERLGGEIGLLLKFSAFCVLEEISFTRKDGQYLRWDYRSGRSLGGKPFNKGEIWSFKDAVNKKLQNIIEDIWESQSSRQNFFKSTSKTGSITVYQDSILTRLPILEKDAFDFIITSPPYANRYDYTRTYALELVFLKNNSDKVKELRQAMLSCTVENKEKIDDLRNFYYRLNRIEDFEKILTVFNENKALHEVLGLLEDQKKQKLLNNNGILRLIKNYFLESCFTIFEMSRVLKKGGRVIMVNDNVRYGGEDVPVDLILSEFAENFGMEIKNIFILQQNKGNSSQQMGNHGRTPLRKCVYLWEK